MREHALPIAVAVVSAAIAAYSLLVVGSLLVGVVAVVALVSTYRQYERGDREQAAVNAVLWTVLGVAFWSGSLAAVVAAAVLDILVLLYWLFLREGRGSGGPSPGTS